MSSIDKQLEWLKTIITQDEEMIRLAIESDWSFSSLYQIYEVMDSFAKKNPQSYNFGDIHEKLADFHISIAEVRSTLLALHSTRKYDTVLKRYVETAGGQIQCQLSDIYEDLVLQK